MLTRREVLLQLKRVGVRETSQMKTHLRDFEKYMAENHGILVEGGRKSLMERKSDFLAHSPPHEMWEKRRQDGGKPKE